MKILAIISAFLAVSCVGKKTATVSYDLKNLVKANVFSQSYYATMDGNYEQVGTITALYFTNEYSQSNDTLYLRRTFVGDASKGYLKKSYPGELAWRVPNLELLAIDNRVVDIKGYENFDSTVVAKITIPDRWREQINRMTRQIDLDRIEQRRYELSHLLLGEVPLNSNITKLLASQGRLPKLPNAQIDSVLTNGIKTINNLKCFEYTVYLQEKEPFPLFIWEQHVSSVKGGKAFKSYKPKDAWYSNRYEIDLNLENGIPCRERELKFGIHGMRNPETGDSVTFKSQISHERFYDY
jgi:hypothetical protein